MNKLKIALFGYDGYTGQIPRYREAFLSLGHELTIQNPDLIYSNDPSGFKSAIELKRAFPNSFLILHVLDIPWHHPGVKKLISSLAVSLDYADAVTINSEKVKKDLLPYYSKKEIFVTYDVSKDVYLDKKIRSKENDFLYVGRANDPIKRIKLVYETLKLIPGAVDKINICGSENPNFGKYLGIIDDKKLNELYNSTKFVLLPSRNEGIGLSMIEGMICGSVPIMCSDNLTAKEFAPSEFICEPNPEKIKEKIYEIDKNYDSFRKLALNYGQKYKVQFNKITIVKKLIEIFNRQKN